MRRFFAMLPIAGLLLLQACGSSGVYVPVTHPAEINLKGFEKIAIGEINGRGSNEMTDDLTIALFNSSRFEVLNRQHIELILREHSLTISGAVDPATAAEIGKLIGAAALIFGNVSEYGYHEELTHEDVVDKKTGKSVRHWERKGKADVTATLQVVDLQTGKIIAISKHDKSETTSKSSEGQEPFQIDRKELLEKARAKVIDEFMRKIAPYTENAYVSFETDEKMPELEKGYQFVKNGDWDRGIEFFQAAVSKYNSGRFEVNKAHYNLGVAYMYTDQFQKARRSFENAYGIKPDGKYQRAIQTLEKRMHEQRELRDQL